MSTKNMPSWLDHEYAQIRAELEAAKAKLAEYQAERCEFKPKKEDKT